MRWIAVILLVGAAMGIAYTLSSKNAVSEREPVASELTASPTQAGARVATGEVAELPVTPRSVGKLAEVPAIAAESMRTTVANPAIRGVVVRDNGDPIANATVSWTVAPNYVMDAKFAWQQVDWVTLDQDTLWSVSDSEGVFVFAEPLGMTSMYGSVLWVTHPAHVATPVVLAPDGQDTSSTFTVTLPDAPTRHALVLDVGSGGDVPVPGAVVRQFALVQDEFDLEMAHALRVFYRAATTDSSGTLPLVTLPGREALYAEAKDRLSEPVARDSGGDITLRLLTSFHAGGLVTLPGGAIVPRVTRVSYDTRQGEEWIPLGSCIVDPDGTWESAPIPIVATDSYRFALNGGGLVHRSTEIETPVAGESILLDFETILGEDLWFQVVDAETEQPLPDSHVKIHWRRPDESWDSLVGQPRDDEHIYMPGCQPGEIYIDADAPGYARLREGPILIPPPEPFVMVMSLERAVPLSGRCLFAGQPVADFSVAYWPAYDGRAGRSEVVRDSEDGSFTLDSVPVGHLNLIAYGEGFGQSKMVSVHVAESGTEDVELELTKALVGHGTIVDQLTGAPIAGASIQNTVSQGVQTIVASGELVYSDASGKFRIDGLCEDRTTFRVTAAGYADRYVTTRAAKAATIDLGRVALSRAQPLEFRLLYPEGADPTQYSIRTHAPVMPKMAFSADGFAHVDSIHAGLHEFLVEMPGGGGLRLDVTLVAGRDWMIDVPVDGTGRLTVNVEGARGSDLPPGLFAEVTYNQGEIPLIHGIAIDELGQGSFEGLPSGAFYLTIARHVSIVAGKAGSLGVGGDASIDITLDEELYRFRVVDEQGNPLPDTYMRFSVDGRELAPLSASTDSDGMYQGSGFPQGDLTVLLSHASTGYAPRVPVTLGSDRGQLIELTLAADRRWAAVLKDGDDPAPGISCLLRGVGSTISAGLAETTGTDGAVDWAGLGEAKYEFLADHAGYWPVRTLLPTTAGPAHVIQVRRRGDLQVEVRNVDGIRITDVAIELTSIEFQEQVEPWVRSGRVVASRTEMTTDARGELLIEGMPHGEYLWQATRHGVAPVGGTTTVPPGETGQLVITLP